MNDSAIFIAGLLVSVIVGSGLSLLIVRNNRDLERQERASDSSTAGVGVRHR